MVATKNDIVLGYGAYQKQAGLLNKLIRFETFFTAVQYFSLAMARLPYMGVGRNLSYTKKLFFDNKGFASHQHILSGDDDLFINEVASGKITSCVLSQNGHTISLPKHTFKAWVRQKRRHLLTGFRYKFKHKLLLGLLQFSQALFWISLIILLFKSNPTEYWYYCLFAPFLLRYIIQLIVLKFWANKLGDAKLIVFIPFFELFFMLFNPILVLSNKIVKISRWS